MYLSIFNICNDYFLVFFIIVPVSVNLTMFLIKISGSNFKVDQSFFQITFQVSRQDYCEPNYDHHHPMYTLMFLCKLSH